METEYKFTTKYLKRELIKNVDYIYTEDRQYRFNDGIVTGTANIHITFINNCEGELNETFKSSFEVLQSGGRMLSLSNSWNFDYINKQLGGILDSYRIDISNIRFYGVDRLGRYIWIYYLDDGSIYYPTEGVDFTIEKCGGTEQTIKYLLTGINKFKGEHIFEIGRFKN